MTERIFIAGHNGMVGSALVRALSVQPVELITINRGELDLLNQTEVFQFLKEQQPSQIYLAAAKVGGVMANQTYPANFLYENLVIACNVIEGSFRAGTKRLLYLGSSCIYPRLAPQPMKEDALLTSTLEPTNEPYALAKIAGIKLCESYMRQFSSMSNIDYRCVMPTNLYGPNDNYDRNGSHVIPGLIRRFHEAKVASEPEVLVWGSGRPRREFLHVDDLAQGCLTVMNVRRHMYDAVTNPRCIHINLGSQEDITIADLASLIATVVGYKGRLLFDASKPDGTPRKLMDSGKALKLGWKPKISLEKGLQATYESFLQEHMAQELCATI